MLKRLKLLSLSGLLLLCINPINCYAKDLNRNYSTVDSIFINKNIVTKNDLFKYNKLKMKLHLNKTNYVLMDNSYWCYNIRKDCFVKLNTFKYYRNNKITTLTTEPTTEQQVTLTTELTTILEQTTTSEITTEQQDALETELTTMVLETTSEQQATLTTELIEQQATLMIESIEQQDIFIIEPSEPEEYEYAWESDGDYWYFYPSGWVLDNKSWYVLCNCVANEAGSDWVNIWDKAKVCEVIFNRIWDWGYDSVYDCVSAPQQFTGSSNYVELDDYYYKVTGGVIDACAFYCSWPELWDEGYHYFIGDNYANYFS